MFSIVEHCLVYHDERLLHLLNIVSRALRALASEGVSLHSQ